jgi:hypothetical protein
MKGPALLLLVLVTACAGSSHTAKPGQPDGERKLEKHQHYVENPTGITGDAVIVILPALYADDLEVKGLGSGWIEDGGKRTWEGSGECRLELHALRVQCRLLTVTLVPPGDELEVLIQASGTVTLAQQVKGVETFYDNLKLLTIRNDRMWMLER